MFPTQNFPKTSPSPPGPKTGKQSPPLGMPCAFTTVSLCHCISVSLWHTPKASPSPPGPKTGEWSAIGICPVPVTVTVTVSPCHCVSASLSQLSSCVTVSLCRCIAVSLSHCVVSLCRCVTVSLQGADPFARGIYSFAQLGVEGNADGVCTDFQKVADPRAPSFAGEHTALRIGPLCMGRTCLARGLL